MKNIKSNNLKFFVKVFGCQYNEWDGDRLVFQLKNSGLVESTEKEADQIYLINCSVRKSAVDRALGVAENYKDQGKQVFVSGCLLEEDKNRFAKKGVNFIEDLPPILQKNKIISDRANLIPIMKGCNNFCSYCVVPYTRGLEISRPSEEIVDDAIKILQNGHVEIWLLGQNVNSYEFGFANLLQKINQIEGNFKIYFTSNHPKDMTIEIITAIKDLPKVAKIIHLPVQSGSDEVLRSMNRPYTRNQYLELIKMIKKQIPEIKITTDFIVGYPTESNEDFQESVELAKKVDFHQAYVNKYSPREGTKSFVLGDPIPWSEKQRRWRMLNDLINKSDK